MRAVVYLGLRTNCTLRLLTRLTLKLFKLTHGPIVTRTSLEFIVIIEYLNNPISFLRNMLIGINRFDFLPFDPQKNSVEPFRRLGENTVLEVLDKHETDCKFDFTSGNIWE